MAFRVRFYMLYCIIYDIYGMHRAVMSSFVFAPVRIIACSECVNSEGSFNHSINQHISIFKISHRVLHNINYTTVNLFTTLSITFPSTTCHDNMSLLRRQDILCFPTEFPRHEKWTLSRGKNLQKKKKMYTPTYLNLKMRNLRALKLCTWNFPSLDANFFQRVYRSNPVYIFMNL